MPSKVLYAFHVLKNIIFKMYSVVPLLTWWQDTQPNTCVTPRVYIISLTV